MLRISGPEINICTLRLFSEQNPEDLDLIYFREATFSVQQPADATFAGRISETTGAGTKVGELSL